MNMEFFHQFIEYVLHIDIKLKEIVTEYDRATYVILALVIFCETGFIVTPFLPGDSLLFAAGSLAGLGLLNLWILIPILFIAAISGDNLNFAVGKFTGEKLINSKRKIIKKEYLDRTHSYYEKHGGKTVIIARFIPIVRTFAPFVAGLGSMTYKKFLSFCLLGNAIWILIFTLGGYLLCRNEWVQSHFSLVTLGIIGISVLPIIIGFFKSKYSKS